MIDKTCAVVWLSCARCVPDSMVEWAVRRLGGGVGRERRMILEQRRIFEHWEICP